VETISWSDGQSVIGSEIAIVIETVTATATEIEIEIETGTETGIETGIEIGGDPFKSRVRPMDRAIGFTM